MNDSSNDITENTTTTDTASTVPEAVLENTQITKDDSVQDLPRLPHETWFAALLKISGSLALMAMLPLYAFLALASIFSYISILHSSTTNMFFPIEIGISNLLAIAVVIYAIRITWKAYMDVVSPYEYYAKLVGTVILLGILSFVLAFSGTMLSIMLRT